MSQIKSLNERHFVVKSNALIEARYRLSLQESHVILWLLTQIRPDDEDFKTHELNVDEFSRMVGLNVKGQYSELQKIIENLMRRILKINQSDTGNVLQVAWLSSAYYIKKKGCVLLRFDPALGPYLLQLKSHFTKIDIADSLKLKSIYAVRIFELLLQYESFGERRISLDDLKLYCGIKEKTYGLYTDLKRRVIDRAKAEINSKTEYEIDYREIKKSRKVSDIEWIIKKKTYFEKSQQEKAVILQKEFRSGSALIEKIIEYGFTKQAAKRLIQSDTEEGITNAIKAVDIQVSRGHVKNPKAMLKTAIEERWKPDIFLSKKIKTKS